MKPSKYIDHTILKPNATSDQIIKLCEEAVANDFASFVSNTLASVVIAPNGKPTTTQSFTSEPAKAALAVGIQHGLIQTDAKSFATASSHNLIIWSLVALGFKIVWSIYLLGFI